MEHPTFDDVKNALDYNPMTGIFYWRHRHDRNASWNSRWAGKRAGSEWRRKGYTSYVQLGLNGYRGFWAHHLAWLYMTGEWPQHNVDHRDGNGLNNRWANLRLDTEGKNRANSGPAKNNRLGVKGVFAKRGRFGAQIRAGGKQMHLGTYDTIEEAQAAYAAAAKERHGEFAKA